MNNMNAVQLEVFEGPLDLLLNLIAKNEIDIYGIYRLRKSQISISPTFT
jgi:hypothetical protein